MNFGKGITIAMILFMLFILYMVYQSFQQKIDLVADNYYEQEVKFQQQIDKSQNVKELGEVPVVEKNENGLSITFPSKQTPIAISGKIVLFRASNNDLDLDIPIKLNEVGIQTIDKDKLVAGKYLLKIEWSFNDKNYYHEEQIVI